MRREPGGPARRARAAQVLFAIGGLAVAGALINGIGWTPIQAAIAAIGLPAAIGLIGLYGLAQLSFCCGWYWTLGPWRRELGLRGILAPFLAGDALNCSIPSANAAGEPLRVAMLRSRIPMEDAVASISLNKFSDFISLALFLGVGLGVSLSAVELPRVWYWGGGIVVFGMTGVAGLLVGIGRNGLFSALLNAVRRFIGPERLTAIRAAAAAIDRNLAQFYANHPKEFLLSIAFNLLGWFGGVVEAFLCLRLLDLPGGWTYALVIETYASFINNVTFFVPVRVGITEGSRAAIFAALGLPAASGMAYGIVRRVREVAWIGLGCAFLPVSRPGAFVGRSAWAWAPGPAPAGEA